MSKPQISLSDSFGLYDFQNFDLRTLTVQSRALEGNPLGDPSLRRNPVLIPKARAPKEGWPVVLVLAGFTGNGPNYFNLKTFELNMPQMLDQAVTRNEAPLALYVFCEAMTSWGGSQFINSVWTGRYGDYVGTELVAAIRDGLPAAAQGRHWCVMGGSSGGYGALQLASSHPETFGLCAAIAPDSFFEGSLLPEFFTAIPTLVKLGGVSGVKKEMEAGRIQKRKDFHSVVNAIAMGLCYGGPEQDPEYPVPVDRETGVLFEDVWQLWKKHDPIVFLRERESQVMRLSGILLDVGTRDQFHLQYGARQIRDVLVRMRAQLDYSEFEGTHFDIGERRPLVWKWLKEQWLA